MAIIRATNRVNPAAIWRARGFSRMDLSVTIAVVACLVAWLAMTRLGERGRIATCARNLAILGQAIHSDAVDYKNELVPAGIDVGGVMGKSRMSWDMELYPYLNPQLAKSSAPDAWGQLMLASAPRFHCPSDHYDRGANPRTYAMAARDMTKGWPPTTEDQTGVGLWWNHRTVLAALGENAWEPIQANPETLPRLSLGVVSDPANTLILTELLARDNLLGSTEATRLFNPNAQRGLPFIQNIKGHSVELGGSGVDADAAFDGGPARYHFGRFNYLMADGHVELLTALQTGGIGYPAAGIWTIKAGD